jgi:pantothenate kinase
MIRNTLFGLSLLALTTGSAFATPVKHTASKPRIVAEAKTPAAAGDSTATDKPAKKVSKKSTKKAKADAAKDMKAAPETK